MPDKVQAVLDVIMAEKREQARQLVRAVGQPIGYWVGSWRTAPEFLSPRLWNRFVWPYMKELVEIVAEEGGTPVLHYDANWDREIERLKELPARRCVLELDGKTDIFRAKKILAGHMCIMGDVPPALLTLGTVDEVKAYCKRLLDRGRPRRLHHGHGLRHPAGRQVRERQGDGGLGTGLADLSRTGSESKERMSESLGNHVRSSHEQHRDNGESSAHGRGGSWGRG